MTKEDIITGSIQVERQFGFITGELDFRAVNGVLINTASWLAGTVIKKLYQGAHSVSANWKSWMPTSEYLTYTKELSNYASTFKIKYVALFPLSINKDYY